MALDQDVEPTGGGSEPESMFERGGDPRFFTRSSNACCACILVRSRLKYTVFMDGEVDWRRTDVLVSNYQQLGWFPR